MRDKDMTFFFNNISILSRAIKLLSIRHSQDMDADEYMKKQFKYTIFGGKTLQNNSLLANEKVLHNSINSKITDMKSSLELLTNKLLVTPMPRETHLAILSANDIGCHHPKLSLNESIPVIDLHTSVGLCLSCPDLLKINLKYGDINPFNCWRRGHRAKRFGFVYQVSLQNVNNKWILKRDKRFNKILSTQLVLSSFRNELSRKGDSEMGAIDFEILNARIARSMMIAIKIASHKIVKTDEIDEIKNILPAQMLVSSHIDLERYTHKIDDTEKLPQFLSDFVVIINQMWKTNSPSINSNGILSSAIVHNECMELVEHIAPSLRQINPELVVVQSNKLEPSIVDAISKSLKGKPGVSICLFLDPIMDIGGDFN